MKISEWLEQAIDSHDIALDEELRKDFREKTGREPSWPAHTVKDTKRDIASDPRGGYVSSLWTNDQQVCYGYQVASSLARKYAAHNSTMIGRGFLFRDCVKALKEKGM